MKPTCELEKIVITQLRDFVQGSLQVVKLGDYLAPIMWELENINDEQSADLVCSVQLLLAEYSAGHLDEAELKNEVSALCA